jgi:hypothetical protein
MNKSGRVFADISKVHNLTTFPQKQEPVKHLNVVKSGSATILQQYSPGKAQPTACMTVG